MSEELVAAARRLARADRSRPRQAELKRAVSTAYYAMFHCLASQAADLLVGTGQRRSSEAWVQVHRALRHGLARQACREARHRGFPSGIAAFAEVFIQLQDERHRADYDPTARYSAGVARLLIALAEQAIAGFKRAPRDERRAFAILALLRRR